MAETMIPEVPLWNRSRSYPPRHPPPPPSPLEIGAQPASTGQLYSKEQQRQKEQRKAYHPPATPQSLPSLPTKLQPPSATSLKRNASPPPTPPDHAPLSSSTATTAASTTGSRTPGNNSSYTMKRDASGDLSEALYQAHRQPLSSDPSMGPRPPLSSRHHQDDDDDDNDDDAIHRSRSYQPQQQEPSGLYHLAGAAGPMPNDPPAPVASMTRMPSHQSQQSYRSNLDRYNSDVQPPSPSYRERLNKWYRKKRSSSSSQNRSHGARNNLIPDTPLRRQQTDDQSSVLSGDDSYAYTTTSATVHTINSSVLEGSITKELSFLDQEAEFLHTKQSIAWLSIAVTSFQLLILMLQLAMCGVASIDINPMIGPFPDAYSVWGGKNAYLMLEQNEWWRLVTPSFLHVGILHLLVNAFCQLGSIAFFEREWGSMLWITIYLLCAVGCQAFSSTFDPNTIAVGSSGTLMGMYAAKMAQVMTATLLSNNMSAVEDVFRVDQLCLTIFGMGLVSLLSCFTYIDWSGHVGGLLTGFLAGMVFFGTSIKGCCKACMWVFFGLVGLVAALGGIGYILITEVEPDEDIADACEYFRVLFTEEYECGCMWDL